MTYSEINAIAEEYATSDCKTNEIVADICQAFLNYLTDRYCIVGREKVEHEMIRANQNIDLFKLYPNVVSANEGVKKVLTRLFGTSMFNQNEE